MKRQGKWNKIFEGAKRTDVEERIFSNLKTEVEKNRGFDFRSFFSLDRRFFLQQMGAAALLVLGISYFILRRDLGVDTPIRLTDAEKSKLLSDPELPLFEPEMLKKAPVIARYDFLKDYDVLEKWGGDA